MVSSRAAALSLREPAARSFPGGVTTWGASTAREARVRFLDRMINRSLRHVLRAAFSIPEPLLRRVAGRVPKNDRGHELDLGIGAFLSTVGRTRPAAGKRPVSAMRHEMNHRAPLADFAGCELHRVHDRVIEGAGHPLPLRIYEPGPRGRGPRPICVYFHGGGFVTGSVRSHDGLCRRIAHRADCIVVSVDYRLAPEHRFPAAALDAIEAFRWTVEHAYELGGEPTRVAVAGDSAGGNLAAVVSWHERATPQPPCFQLLVYPVTDYVHATESHRLYASGFLHDDASMRWFRGHYFGEREGDRDDPRASVLRAPDLRGAAPAHIVTAGFDPLRDDGERYAERLAEHDVPVELVCEERMVHGFFSLGGILSSANDAVDRAIVALAAGVRR
jgi:acetyl esterase